MATIGGRRGSVVRLKPKKKPNRYNPNAPDWNAVHAGWAKLKWRGR